MPNFDIFSNVQELTALMMMPMLVIMLFIINAFVRAFRDFSEDGVQRKAEEKRQEAVKKQVSQEIKPKRYPWGVKTCSHCRSTVIGELSTCGRCGAPLGE